MVGVLILNKAFLNIKGNTCYIPTSGRCFLNCIKFSTGNDYKENFLTFGRDVKRRNNVMTSGRFHPFGKLYSIIIGCFDGSGINRKNLTEKNIALYIH